MCIQQIEQLEACAVYFSFHFIFRCHCFKGIVWSVQNKQNAQFYWLVRNASRKIWNFITSSAWKLDNSKIVRNHLSILHNFNSNERKKEKIGNENIVCYQPSLFSSNVDHKEQIWFERKCGECWFPSFLQTRGIKAKLKRQFNVLIAVLRSFHETLNYNETNESCSSHLKSATI